MPGGLQVFSPCLQESNHNDTTNTTDYYVVFVVSLWFLFFLIKKWSLPFAVGK